MNSLRISAVTQEEKQKQIRAQIAQLQAQLVAPDPDSIPAAGLKRDHEPDEPTADRRKVLVPGSPSPKRRRIDPGVAPKARGSNGAPAASLATSAKVHQAAKANPSSKKPAFQPPPPPRASNVVAALAAVQPSATSSATKVEITRSAAFTQAPAPSVPAFTPSSAPTRDDTLALIENLEPGPVDHKPPPYDPMFETFEPNSRINLLSRKLPHDEFQEYLRGRYYLSPSLLYSVIRPLQNKQGYDVPVAGDWVTIAVVAERGKIQLTKGGVKKNGEHADIEDEADEANAKAKPQETRDGSKKKLDKKPYGGKKFVNVRLVDFGHRSSSHFGSASKTKSTVGGDALLSMLLFEADSYSALCSNEGLDDRIYKGGSGGAFEKCSKFPEGTVIAILNPKILKPFQRTGDKPHPTTNVLAITPENAESIVVLGKSKDLGRCGVVKRDGKTCGSWCDKRVSEVCEYHVLTAVKSARAGRAEFSIGTSGMSSTAHAGKSKNYDPDRKWGLQPANGASRPSGDASSGGGATYLFSGHVINSRAEYVSEKLGRERGEREERKRKKEEEAVLGKLLSRDGGRSVGALAVEKARRAVLKEKGKGKEKEMSKAGDSDEDATGNAEESGSKKGNAYSAQAMRSIGFDPTPKGIRGTSERQLDPERLEALKSLTSLSGKKDISLRSRPGKRRSGVSAPVSTLPKDSGLGLSNDELEIVMEEKQEEAAGSGTGGGGSDSDSELEIEPPISTA
ncbi:hypothetical protein BOTBODRAFT_51459 [Botryobasidium botryosum FD-172 SS1]|uniref:Zinc finger Mcm10/DnaG-type domain-containing protein n=1 Tax=Botryobasidium botryosum (strain FD-172 SS1) TaxID=930990 RepID=A0A067N7K1_BOTB1|nr:hypothetical protein BOTBODRAFT_51459 [Botryobasidium botryosum FD-172 SS1]